MKTHDILVVDDIPGNLRTIIGYLKEMNNNYGYMQAINGEMALKTALKKLPDLIITDWEMPVMNGIQLIKELKKNPKTTEIPIIMASGIMTSSENLQTAMDAGAIDYIKKPIDKIELRARVRSMLKLSDYNKQIIAQNSLLIKQKDDILKKTQNLQQANKQIILINNNLAENIEELKQAHEEIKITSDNLEKQNTNLEQAYNNVKLLSNIGQSITVSLNIKNIINNVYTNVNKLIKSDIFSIGIFNNEKNAIEFEGTIENGQKLPIHYDKFDENCLSIRCYKNNESIHIDNLSIEYFKYFKSFPKAKEGKVPESILYIPLTSNNKPIGVISTQSFKKNVYKKYHKDILSNIAIYTSIAVENAKKFKIINKQNILLENYTTRIEESIKYAKNIQQAMLPSKIQIDKELNCFIIYKPKDIVSGDFYWFGKQETTTFVAVVDCTGHGVPGAFMSMIGNSLLNEIIKHMQITNPKEVLHLLNIEIIKLLNQNITNNTDGMDLSLCRIDKNNNQIKIIFSGAKQKLFYSKNNEIHIIKGDRSHIGGTIYNKNKDYNFTNKEIFLSTNDNVYLTTDGYIDQNNSLRKRFGTKRLKNKLSQITNKTLQEQKLFLETELIHWQGKEEQRDDIALIGIKL